MRTRQLDDNVGLGRELAGCFGVWMLGKRVCLTQTGNSGRQAYVGRRRLRSGKEVQQVFMPAHTVSKTPCPPGSLCTHRCPDIPVTHIPLVVHPNGCFCGAFWPCPPPYLSRGISPRPVFQQRVLGYFTGLAALLLNHLQLHYLSHA